MSFTRKVKWIAGTWVLFWLIVNAVVGCSRPSDGPACTPGVLLGLERDYVIEAAAACKAEGARSLSECVSAGPIRAKYRALRAAYVECK